MMRWLAALAAILIIPACGDGSGRPFAADPDGRGSAGSAGGGQQLTVRIIRPDSGASASEGSTLAIEADVTDPNGVLDRVDFYDDNRRIASISDPPYTFTTGRLKAGTHLLCAVGVDFEGGTVASAPVTLFVIRAHDEARPHGRDRKH